MSCMNGLEFGSKCYIQYNSLLDWHSAFLTCAGRDTTTSLVTVDNLELNTFLQTNVINDERVWIGLGYGKPVYRTTWYWSFVINKHNWTWSDGTHTTYSDWTDASVISECVVMTKIQTWYTQPCTYQRNFVCEKDMSYDTCGTWQVHENHCYLFVDTLTRNCMNAARFCWYEEAYLLSINNQQEAQFVYQTLVNTTEYWIGLSPLSWADGSPYQWNNWDDNGPSIDKKCTFINKSTGKWSSEDCEYKWQDFYRFICQRDIIVTTIYPSESSIESHTMDQTYGYSTTTVSNNSERQGDRTSEHTNPNTDVYIAIIATLVIIVIGLVIGMTGVCVYFKRRWIPKTRTQEEPTIYYNDVQTENAHTTVQRYILSNTAIKNPDTIPEDKQTNTYEHLSQDPDANSKTITDGPYASLE